MSGRTCRRSCGSPSCPTGSPLAIPWAGELLMAAVGATVPVFGFVGAVSWYRRHPWRESWMLWAYFAETLAYPYTNQRRVILVLPLVTIWYVIGARSLGAGRSPLEAQASVQGGRPRLRP